MVNERISANASIAASILTFAVSILGISNIRLTTWWHFLVAIIALAVCFFLCLIVVDVGLRIFAKIKRPDPMVNFRKDYSDIERMIEEIGKKDVLHDRVASDEYKAILSREIQLQSNSLKEKMDTFLQDSRNPVIKNRPKIPDKSLFEMYGDYCVFSVKWN